MNKFNYCTLALLCAFVLPTQASLGSPIYTLADQNSVAEFDLGTQAGQFSWTVEGTQQLSQQWFWYRVGPSGPEASLDTIGLPIVNQPVPNFLSATYTQPNSFTATLSLFLTGGQVGSGTSDIAETIRINNTSGAALDFHFFQFVNFDLNGSPLGDTVEFLAPNTVEQRKSSTVLTETVITPTASLREAAFFSSTRDSLNDLNPTTLNDNYGPVGPGDVTWAFEWDRTIPAGGSLLISKDKQLMIPEPMALSLLAIGGAAVMWRRRRR